MSEQYKGQDPLDIAAKAEQDLADPKLKQERGGVGFGGKTVTEGNLSGK